MTRTLTARFDGKVIVPDDRPELPINQRLRLTVEPLENGTPPNGTPGIELLRFAGTLSDEDAQAMKRAIEEDCEQVDPDAW
jgi:hypothetical protein